jgi:RNA polymerase sigma factor (sigma-70 family)
MSNKPVTEVTVSRGPVGGLLAFLRRLPPAPDSDDVLLDRFARVRDADAFAALVARHGPMVFAVCRRALGETGAEDAFQAVFLALAHNAGRVNARGAISGWLYRVALRTARRLATRARTSEPLPYDVQGPSAPDAAHRELLAALDDEVSALPDRLRAAVVLCALEGRTNTEAAAVLGCPVGTIDSRLHAAKRRLHDRLARRGFGLPAIGAAIAAISLETAQNASAAARLTPAVLATTTSESPSPAVAAILQEVMSVRTHFKLFAAVGFALLLAGAGFALHALADPPKMEAPTSPAPRSADAPLVAPKPTKADEDYRDALVAALQYLSVKDSDIYHLARFLERHPKLANERMSHRKGNNGYTAIHFAARNGNDRIVRILLETYKVDPNTLGWDYSHDGYADWAPLHFAAHNGHLETCKILVKAGAKLDLKATTVSLGGIGGFGPLVPPEPRPAYTAREWAKMAKHDAVVEYLAELEKPHKP